MKHVLAMLLITFFISSCHTSTYHFQKPTTEAVVELEDQVHHNFIFSLIEWRPVDLKNVCGPNSYPVKIKTQNGPLAIGVSILRSLIDRLLFGPESSLLGMIYTPWNVQVTCKANVQAQAQTKSNAKLL